MERSSSHRKIIRHQFDSFCKKVLSGEAKDRKKENARRLKHEIPFSEMPPGEIEQIFILDEYSTDSTAYNTA